MANRNIIVIGGSAGGLQVLQTIVSALPWDFQASVFIVLHTTEDSPGLLPQILNRYSKVPVMYAVHNAPILPSRVYVAPVGKRHMLLDRGKVRVAADLSEKGIAEIKAEERMQGQLAEQALQDFEVELGMRSPETTPVAQSAKDLGPATEKQTN